MNEANITKRLKNRDQMRKTRADSENQIETPDFVFNYADCDQLCDEIAELYTYSEESEFLVNSIAFERQFKPIYNDRLWRELTYAEKYAHIQRLLNLCEISNRQARTDIYRAILYVAQGNFYECDTLDDHSESVLNNIILLYECDTFSFFTELFHYEAEIACSMQNTQPKLNLNIGDNVELRVIANILYTMIEIIRTLNVNLSEKYKRIRESLKSELSTCNKNSEMFATYLFDLALRFCNQNMTILPIKKIVLLLWKILLFTLGGLDDVFKLKNEKREAYGLPLIKENPMDIINKMSPATPPPNPIDLVNEIQNGNGVNNGKRWKKNGLTKQTRGIDNDEYLNENDTGNMAPPNETIGINNSENNLPATTTTTATTNFAEDDVYPNSPRPKSPETNQNYLPFSQSRSLPWNPKVKQPELEQFVDQARKKFLGYGDLLNDVDTLIGLPYPIHESVKILKEHLYTSLSEYQMKAEEKLLKYPLSSAENTEDTPAECLYKEILPNFSPYIVSLLRILLAAIPQQRQKQDSLQILSDLTPEDFEDTNVFNIKLNIDSNRHKEILIKAISAILLLMLKHFKVNHAYQFECMSQHLLFANCMPLILKFFNLNIIGFIHSKNNHMVLDYPYCVINVNQEVTADLLENGDSSVYRWRNVFSCINLLRVLNKLTKYKRSRIMMLVIFKSGPTLKKLLRIKQTMLQYYALKLIKLQTKHLGRQWRKTNMSTMSAIYQKVRHRLNDDWAYGQDLDTQQWDFQADECSLRTQIDRFNQRRYRSASDPLNPDFIPLANNTFKSCLSKDIEMPKDFEQNYEQWLNDEVFANEINWDLVLNDKTIPIVH